jgi:RHS repeat-associated protein
MAVVRYTTVSGEIIAEKRNGVRSCYVPDPLGSTRALLDSTQTQTDTFEYWPYGETQASTGDSTTRFRFVGTAGYVSDPLDRTYVRARHYSRSRGMWYSQDPIWIVEYLTTLYHYCHNSPTSETDPLGLIPPVYGEFCGPQTVPGIRPPVDPLDGCCADHDECWASQSPPCDAFNQWSRCECRSCTSTMCDCVKRVGCSQSHNPRLCKFLLPIITTYACGPAGWGSSGNIGGGGGISWGGGINIGGPRGIGINPGGISIGGPKGIGVGPGGINIGGPKGNGYESGGLTIGGIPVPG